jgi:hypothetical protein
MGSKKDAAAAARLWREVSQAGVPEDKQTEPPDPVVFGTSK